MCVIEQSSRESEQMTRLSSNHHKEAEKEANKLGRIVSE